MHWVAHIFGIDTQQSYWYDFWSGIATQATVVLAALGAYAKHRCHRRHCVWVGKHQVDGTPWCSRHRPSAPEL